MILGLTACLTFCGFIGLKIAGLLSWSWWWVTSPIWIAAIYELLKNVFQLI
jgi:hypothetical protein